MTAYTLYLFNQNGACLHYTHVLQEEISISKEEELMCGMHFSVDSFVSNMSLLDMELGFLAFKTS